MIELLESIEYWHWWVFSALLVTIEVFVPSTIVLWPGVAAAVVGFVVLAADDIGWRYQFVLFVALSVACLFVWGRYQKSRLDDPEDPRPGTTP